MLEFLFALFAVVGIICSGFFICMFIIACIAGVVFMKKTMDIDARRRK